jgi:CheY-like chemotaxis protein
MDKKKDKDRKKLLLVDDEPLVIKILKRRLESKHFIVITASNGQEAIEKARVDKPDVIILDVSMPEMDGPTACKQLKKDPETKAIPVIMFTALEQFGLEEKCQKAGAVGVAYKPTIKDVLEIMERIFGGEDVSMDEDVYGKDFNIGE